MNFIIEVADKVLNGGEVTRAEAERLINVSDEDTMLLLGQIKSARNITVMLSIAALLLTAAAGAARKTANSARSPLIIIPALKNIRC